MLLLLTIASVAIGYGISIFVAQCVGASQFEDYVVTIATLGLFAVIAESGTGKFAYKLIPGSETESEIQQVAGYFRFSATCVVSISLGLIVFEIFGDLFHDREMHNYPLGVGVLFLPLIALAGVVCDFVIASGAPVAGMLVARILIPVTTLSAMWLIDFVWGLTAERAVLGFGLGSTAGVFCGATLLLMFTPRRIWQATPRYNWRHWARECFQFSAVAFLFSCLFRTSVIVVEWLPTEEHQAGYFAAAFETGMLILLFGKSTDKLFQSEITLVVKHQDWEQGLRLRRIRHLVIGTGCLIFLLVMIIWGKTILAVFGPEFVVAYPALCLISIGNCVWTLFSLSPYFLRLIERDRIITAIGMLGALGLVLLTVVLGTSFGLTGAAAAFCITISAVSLAYMSVAMSIVAKSRQTPNPGRLEESSPFHE